MTSVAKPDLAAMSEQFNADVAETDPEKVAALLEGSIDRYLRQTDGWSGDQPVPYHCGFGIDLADLTTLLAADTMLHGYDVACAVGVPWPIAPPEALLALGAYAPLMPAVVNRATAAGHTAAYGLSLRGGPSLEFRFTDGALALEPPGGPVDCELDLDPVAAVLVMSGRMERWPAIATGLLAAGGARPELATGFWDFFAFP